jgi:membrane-associated phospholipid phosphatase
MFSYFPADRELPPGKQPTSECERVELKKELFSCPVVAGVVLLVMTLPTTAAGAYETPSTTVLPDAPSAVLVRSSLSPPEEGSRTCLPSCIPPSSEESTSQHDATQRTSVLRRIMRDQKEIYTAPFHRRNVKWDLLFLAATGGLIAGDKHISGALPRNHVDISQDISNVGLYSMTASLAGLWLSSLKTHDAHARETGILAAEAFANTAAVLGLTQVIMGRERPTEGNGNGSFWQNNTLGSSFPSAHSSFTWTMASVVAHEYPKPWVQWLAYGTATTVSVTRVTGLRHFPSDVAVGGTFGYLIGQQIFHAHCMPGLSSHCRSSRKNVSKEKTISPPS